jgi:Fe-S oxidoreductase
LLGNLVSAQHPLIGLEPSAILTFRDEYPDLANDENLSAANNLATNSFFIDEFLAKEMEGGFITKEQFTNESKSILLHGHCQQKAVSNLSDSVKVLSFPAQYKVETIPSGCCGMAGSFGYEKEHYAVSMNIGELVLFPTVRAHKETCTIAAPGTSCRHQIKDGTGVHALHTVEVLFEALV